MIQLEVGETDNRDPHTTTLVMGQPGIVGSVYKVDVDPFELFKNMVENNFEDNEDIDTSDLQAMIDFLKQYL